MRKLFMLAALAVGLSLPAGVLPGQAGIDVVDQMGRAVHLGRVPRRIVSLAPSNTELLFALGLGSRIVGVTNYCNYPPQALGKPKIGDYAAPDIERVAAQAPDLVVAERIHYRQVVPALERVGLKVIGLDPKNVAEVLASLDLLGRATGTEDAARLLRGSLQARIDRVRAQVGRALDADPGRRPKVFYLIWHEPLFTAGGDTFQGELIAMAGGRNLFGHLKGYPQVNLESVLAGQPDLILVGAGHEETAESPALSWALSEPRLKGTPALRAGRVRPVDADLVSRAGPRVADALEELLRLIHPELGFPPGLKR